MSSYRIKPGTIPKHLKVPQRVPQSAPRPAGSRPPIRNAPAGSLNEEENAGKRSWFGLPRRQPGTGWFGRPKPRDIAREHPHAKMRDARSVRIYDLIVKASVPVMFAYFVFYSPAGEQSDIAIIRRWSEGLRQDIWDWWHNVPRDEEVDPQILLRMEESQRS